MVRPRRCSSLPDKALRIELIEKTGSTSADLLQRLSALDPVEEGAWLVAERQVSGRGRQGRSWLDGPGNFMGSTTVHLHPQDPPAQTLSFAAALATYEAVVAHLAVPQALQLKWPNDLLLGGAKIAGILLERSGNVAVVGIGVNLSVAPHLGERATGYLAQRGPAPDRDAFARDLAASFDRELGRWRQYGTEALFKRWLAAAHPLGSPLAVHNAEGVRETGEFAGLEPDGALRLRLADGTVRVVHAGDVTIEGG
ncbi:MAG: biotin--[acetyl-CoA-carboxylase] ligase [Porphyrobacter sp.]|nr:biotin--[acetyl-CoA-carboxylase] ligase [Porphyrobacter sp.]